MQILSTKDYGKFKPVKGNRPVNMRHVNDLTASIMTNNMLAQNPITINKKSQVIDGQHRLEVAKNNKLTIYYTVMDHGDLDEVQRLNRYVKPWTTLDYLHSYIAVGNPYYIRFKEFIDQYQISTEQAFLLIGNDNGGRIYRSFRAGKYTFTDDEMEKARDKADIILDVKGYFIDNGASSVYFGRFINLIHEKGLGKRFVDKVKSSGLQLKRQHNLRDYLRMGEDVLNFGQKTNIVRLF